MGPTVEDFEQKVAEVPLTPAPKQYTIQVSRVRYRKRGGSLRTPARASTRLNGA
jgi:hypothetical protein